MRFLIRALVGLGLLAATSGLLIMAVSTLHSAFEAKRDSGNRPRMARERSFSANVAKVALQDIRPVIETFGEVRSGRTMELRAASGGAIVELSENFREGGVVDSGDLLFRTDPAAARARFRLAEAEVAEANAELRDAEIALGLAGNDLEAAETQLGLRLSALERQNALNERGVGTESALETAGWRPLRPNKAWWANGSAFPRPVPGSNVPAWDWHDRKSRCRKPGGNLTTRG